MSRGQSEVSRGRSEARIFRYNFGFNLMSLVEGGRIGPYVIVCQIGLGGMGQVFKARDTTLNRDVALKVLPAQLAGDQDRLARLRREARVLASLNHPNIAHVHGFEESGAVHALVMELVEGPTLADRIATGLLALDEVLSIARQMAEALEAAHEQGVVHRDLKPANIKVRPDGTVKILDFGIAKAVDTPFESVSHGMNTPEALTTLTMAGSILGTATYMSPEQAKGKSVDRRTDIWAFGAVVFEMLSGRRAFTGDTTSETLAAVLLADIDWSVLPSYTPPALRSLLERCLDREVKTRLRDIGEARIELARLAGLSTRSSSIVPTSVRKPRTGAPSAMTRWIAVAAVVVAAGAVTWGWYQGRAVSRTPTRTSILFPEASPLQLGQSQPSLAFSPDGRTIVYSAAGPEGGVQLWRRDINEFTPQPLAGTAGGRLAFFSPDGAWIGFMGGGHVMKMPVAGGAPATVCDYAGVPMGGTWTTKGEIVFATRATAQGLWKVPASGGVPVPLTKTGVWYPDALPNGRAVVATMYNATADESVGDLTVAAISLDDGKVTPLFEGGTYVRYSPTGHLIYLRRNSLMGAPFDADTLAVGASRGVVIDQVYMDQAIVSGNFAISPAGAIAYAPGDSADFKRAVINVAAPGAPPIVGERRSYRSPRSSPDGRTLAVVENAWRDRIWLVDIARQSFTRLSSGRYMSESAPVWSPDGKRIVFRAVGDDSAINLYVVAADGSGQERRLLNDYSEAEPTTWTADGRSILFTANRADGNSDTMAMDVDGPPNVRTILNTAFSEQAAAMAPGGRWMAYVSSRSGKSEVYVSAFPSMTPTVQVSTRGGSVPVWSRDGRSLYYRVQQQVMAVDISGASASAPRVVAPLTSVYASDFIDAMPDGRIIGISGAPITTMRELRVVFNWFDELRQRVK